MSKALAKFADSFNMDPQEMKNTLVNTVFRQQEGVNITDEQMGALMIVAKEYKLNPFTKELYAFPDKNGGVVPVLGIDGWIRIVNSHPDMEGFEVEYSNEMEKLDDYHVPCPAWCEVTLHKKGWKVPGKARERLASVYRPPFVKNAGTPKEWINKGPWQTHTERQLFTKAYIQAARRTFGFSGLYDEDEANRIIENQEIEVNNPPFHVEPTADQHYKETEIYHAPQAEEILPTHPPKTKGSAQKKTSDIKARIKKMKKESQKETKTCNGVEEDQKINLLLERIQKTDTIDGLNELISECHEFGEHVRIEEIRAAWSDKNNQLQSL